MKFKFIACDRYFGGMNKKDAARILYNQGWQQNEIAQTLGITAKTVSAWKRKDNWDKRLSEISLMKETAEESVYELIAWNLFVLKHKKDEWERDKEYKLIERGDIDALTKLFAAIRGKEKSWTHYVTTIREFIDFLNVEDLELAKQLIPFTDAFLNEKRSQL